MRSTNTLTHPPTRWTLPIVLTAQFVTPLSISGTAIALAHISEDLGSHSAALQWVVNGFNIIFAIGVLLWGRLSDRIGYRLTFTLGATFFALGSIISALTPSLIILDIARIIAGLGAAAILPGASALLSQVFEGNARTRAFALFGTVNGLGLALGPSISGLLIGSIGWRSVFAIQALILSISALSSRFLPSSSPQTPQNTEGSRILDLSLLRNREFLAMCLVPVAGSIGFVTLLTYLPSALSGIRSLSPDTTGLIMLSMTLPVLLAPTLAAKLVESIPRITVISIIYMSIFALILGNIGILFTSDSQSLGWIILPMILLGFGFGLPIGLLDGYALSVIPHEHTGTASGVLNFFRIGSEALFVALYSLVLSLLIKRELPEPAATYTAAGQPGHPDAYASSFETTVTGILILLIALTVIILFVRRKNPDSQH